MKPGRSCAFILTALILVSCNGGSMSEKAPAPRTLDAADPVKLERLLGSRIFFGHQSVGYNIVEGIGDVLREKGMQVVFEESRVAGGSGPRFLHSRIGKNGDPMGKIADFDAIMRGGMADAADIAFMKMCYLDVYAGSDVEATFAAYKAAMSKLSADFPKTTFVHLTVPITAAEKGLKPLVKRLLGRGLNVSGDNLARETLNSMLRREYSAGGKLFDLAMIESTGMDGMRRVYERDGRKYFNLFEGYTEDGGHLNAAGRRIVSEDLLVFLTGIIP
jgi:hypothetical protein